MRNIIAVDWDTMKELADEEARVRSEITDVCEYVYREEALRRVARRRGDSKMLGDLEKRHLASVRAFWNTALEAAKDLDMAEEEVGGYMRDRDPRLDQLRYDAVTALDSLGLYIAVHVDGLY